MVLKYHISPSAISEAFVVKIWEASADGVGAEIYTSPDIPAPHVAPYTLTVNGLDKVVHIVRMYTKISAILLHEFNAEPKTDIVTMYSPIQFKIGDGGLLTPANGDTEYVNPLLSGLTNSDVLIIRGTSGPMFPGNNPGQFQVDGANNKFVLNVPDQFSTDEEFTVQIKPTVVTSVINDSVVGKWFAGFVDVNSSRDYLNSDLRKLIRLNGTSQYTFPVGQVIPIGYGFGFQKFALTAGTARVNFLNGTLLWGSTPKTFLDLPDNSELMVSWDGTNWNVVYYVNLPPQPINKILASGKLFIGDVPAGEQTYTINHGLGIVGDYNVFFSNRAFGSVSAPFDNNVNELAWYPDPTDASNKFKICIREDAPSLQQLTICWLIIQL